ncbi:MAG: hypothetical protein ABSB78_08060 [Bacteroidota bacterium]
MRLSNIFRAVVVSGQTMKYFTQAAIARRDVAADPKDSVVVLNVQLNLVLIWKKRSLSGIEYQI